MSTANVRSKVAIIGLGNIGKAIATNLVKGGHPVILASRNAENSANLGHELGNLATPMSTSDAILEADIIIPAIYFNSLKDFFRQYFEALGDKIIIDVSNPIAPDGNGGFKKIIGDAESATQLLSQYVPQTAKLVKAFGTLGAGSLAAEAFAEPDRKVLFYASDSTNSNAQIEDLIKSSGFDPAHIGGINNAIRIEVFGDLHQFGKLGKTVTLSEAKSIF